MLDHVGRSDGPRLRIFRTAVLSVTISVFIIAYAYLSFMPMAAVVRFRDSASYIVVNFTGHAQRLWVVPLIYWLAGNDHARIVVQSVIGMAAWILLALEVGHHLRTFVVRWLTMSMLLLVGLTQPLIEWNRTILSESLAISFTLLLFTAWLHFLDDQRGRNLALVLLAATGWAFTRQIQAFSSVILLLPLALLAWRNRASRRILLIGLASMVVISGLAVTSSLQASREIVAVNSIDIVQFRLIENPAALRYLTERGMPFPGKFSRTAPLARVGMSVNDNQYADMEVLDRLLYADPKLNAWMADHGADILRAQIETNPFGSILTPLRQVPDLMTVDAGYAPGRTLPAQLNHLAYGSYPSSTSTTGGIRQSRPDPIYLELLLLATAIAIARAAWQRRFNTLAMASLGALCFAAVWTIGIWLMSTAELPRLMVPPSALVHVAALALIASQVDDLIADRRREVCVYGGTGSDEVRTPTSA